MLTSRIADRIRVALWGRDPDVRRGPFARWARRRRIANAHLWNAVDALEESIAALAEAVADITLEMAGSRTRTDAELTMLRERLETLERNAVEDVALLEDACRGRVLRHTEEHHVARVGLKETT